MKKFVALVLGTAFSLSTVVGQTAQAPQKPREDIAAEDIGSNYD